MGKRGNGEGSIYRDEAKGTWAGAISFGSAPDGEPRDAPPRARFEAPHCMVTAGDRT